MPEEILRLVSPIIKGIIMRYHTSAQSKERLTGKRSASQEFNPEWTGAATLREIEVSDSTFTGILGSTR